MPDLTGDSGYLSDLSPKINLGMITELSLTRYKAYTSLQSTIAMPIAFRPAVSCLNMRWIAMTKVT